MKAGGGHPGSKGEETHLCYSPALKVMEAEGWNPAPSGAYWSPLPAGWWSVGSAVCGHTSSLRTTVQQQLRHKSRTALTHTSTFTSHEQREP